MPMSRESKVDRIHKTTLFQRANRKTLEELAQVLDEVEVSPGCELITQGRHHHESYIVETGILIVLVDGDEVAEIRAGEIVGEIGLLDPGPATATVQCKTPATLLALPHNRAQDALDAIPDVYRHIASELAHRLRSMDANHHRN